MATSFARRRLSVRLRSVAALFVALVVVVLVFAPRPAAADSPGPPTLYVCFPADVKSAVLERALQTNLPGLAVTVFGRYRDFEEALAAKRPDAVLGLRIQLDAKGLKPTLVGVSEGKDYDKVVLVSAGVPLQGSLANRTIGVIDVLGRKETQDLVVRLTGAPTVKVKLVTKAEDLLSLLQFSAADAVLMRAGLLKMLAERTRLSLQVRDLPNDSRIGRTSLAVLTPAVRDVIVKQVQGLDAATNRMLEIDGWRVSK